MARAWDSINTCISRKIVDCCCPAVSLKADSPFFPCRPRLVRGGSMILNLGLLFDMFSKISTSVSKIDKGRVWKNLWGRGLRLPCREVPCVGDLQYRINLNNLQSGTAVLSGNNLRLFRCPSFIPSKTPFEKLEIRHEPFLISLGGRSAAEDCRNRMPISFLLHRRWDTAPNSGPLKIG